MGDGLENYTDWPAAFVAGPPRAVRRWAWACGGGGSLRFAQAPPREPVGERRSEAALPEGDSAGSWWECVDFDGWVANRCIVIDIEYH